MTGQSALRRVAETLDWAACTGELRIEPFLHRIPLLPEPSSEPPSEPAPKPAQKPASVPLDTYELVVIDELGKPLAGIEVVMNTPLGTQIKPTTGGGSARVDQEPEGIGSARLRDILKVREALAGRENQKRRMTKFPDESDVFTIRTLSGATDEITLHSGVRHTLMLVTRTDVYSVGHPASWGKLAEDPNKGVAPWTFEAALQALLFLHADGTRANAGVIGESPKPPNFPPPSVVPPVPLPPAAVSTFAEAQALHPVRAAQPAPGKAPPPRFLEVDLDALHDALFTGDLNRALAIMAAQPVDPPEVQVTPPPSLLESLLVDMHRIALALQGVEDPPFQEVPEVVPLVGKTSKKVSP
jgi:hypothetical protein